MSKNIIIVVLLGLIILVVWVVGGIFLQATGLSLGNKTIQEDFSQPISAVAGKSFGSEGQLTFELYRNGTFVIDGESEYAWQKSDSYRDSAFIRSTHALPKTYTVSVTVGEIDYDLDNIHGLSLDPQYFSGPTNENGCYLLAITDTNPRGHHTNDWWHKHRKLVIDVDNNVWGHGMPNPIFMVYFDKSNKLMSFDGRQNEWQSDWRRAVQYKEEEWYKVEIEKTETLYILSIYDNNENLLKRGEIELSEVWHADDEHSEYFVVGDPHENYYQGSMKIKNISIRY